MKKIVFFPYHPDLKTLIDHKDSLRDYQISGFVSYKEDKILIHSLNEALGLETVSYDQVLHNCDAVIILDNYRDYEKDKYYQVIDAASRHQKDIFITPLAESQLDLKNHQGQYKLLELLPNEMDAVNDEYLYKREKQIYEIDIPVIGVFGQGKNCDKFENQLLLKTVLEKEYETITVTTNALGALFGCYTIPSFLYEDHPFEEKILKINYYIRTISKLGKPDIIVLGIPEGITPFKRQEFHHFAEYPLIISTAVPIDIAFMCTYFMQNSALEYSLKKIAEFCQSKFGIPVVAITMSRTAIEVPYEEFEKIVFEYLDEAYLSNHYPDLRHINLPMINMLNQKEAAETIKTCLRHLQANVRMV